MQFECFYSPVVSVFMSVLLVTSIYLRELISLCLSFPSEDQLRIFYLTCLMWSWFLLDSCDSAVSPCSLHTLITLMLMICKHLAAPHNPSTSNHKVALFILFPFV